MTTLDNMQGTIELEYCEGVTAAATTMTLVVAKHQIVSADFV